MNQREELPKAIKARAAATMSQSDCRCCRSRPWRRPSRPPQQDHRHVDDQWILALAISSPVQDMRDIAHGSLCRTITSRCGCATDGRRIRRRVQVDADGERERSDFTGRLRTFFTALGHCRGDEEEWRLHAVRAISHWNLTATSMPDERCDLLTPDSLPGKRTLASHLTVRAGLCHAGFACIEHLGDCGCFFGSPDGAGSRSGNADSAQGGSVIEVSSGGSARAVH